MSSENEDPRSSDDMSEKLHAAFEKPKLSYSRDFLLSLSNLDSCKTLPAGFDKSILSEFESASQSIPDRPRIPGSLVSQGFRRNEYGSSPPTRGDSGNYSRITYGKWDSRNSGRSDRDSDSQSDKDSDSGKRFGNYSRRSWQTPEHDGLLGSGSFPRPSGYAGGISGPKSQTSDNYQLNKTHEPYHPPRPYKAVPHLRRDTDSINDETFGSLESTTSEDRAEEEKKRRASFELMRKEQQKVLQEKQKLNVEKRKSGGTLEISEVLEESKEEKEHDRNNEPAVPAATSISSNDLERPSFASNSPAIRPLVPPGFRSNIPEKSSGAKSVVHPHLSVVGKADTETLLDAEANLVQNDTRSEQRLSQENSLVHAQPSNKTQHVPLLNEGIRSNLHAPVRKLSTEDHLRNTSNHLNSHGTMNDHKIVELDAEILEEKTVGDSTISRSTSILEKIFGNTLSMDDGGSGSAEFQGSKPDDTGSPKSVQSSKFARWFSEEEAQVPGDVSFGRPTDLLSLIATGDQVRYQVSETEAAGNFVHNGSHQTSAKANNPIPGSPPTSDMVSNQINSKSKVQAVPTILTCEDLEQSILSDYGPRTTDAHRQLKSQSTVNANIEEPSADINASVNLLSLLHKGAKQTNTTPLSGIGINLVNNLPFTHENDMVTAVVGNTGEENAKNVPNIGKSLTLETLFGTAFMKELQSVEAPVSVQRSNGPARGDASNPHGLPFQSTHVEDISSPIIDKIGLQRSNHDSSGMSSDHRQQKELSKAENWLGLDDPQIGITSLEHRAKSLPRVGGFEEVLEVQLPEEENLIGDPQYNLMSTIMASGMSSSNAKPSSNAPGVTGKLAVLGSLVKDERTMAGSESLAYAHGPYEQMELPHPHHSLQLQQPSQFQPPQVTQVRPLYNQTQSHPDMKFLGLEHLFNRDSPGNHQFPSNNIGQFHNRNIGVAGYEALPHNPTMLHQVQMPGNPPHLLPNYPRTAPPPIHMNQMNQMNQMQGFPIRPRQPRPNMGSHGVQMPVPGPNVNSGTPPEAFQRLIEMELRANSKQIPPFPPGHSPQIYGHEVEMGFHYR